MLFCPDKGIFRYASELTHGCQFKKQIGQEGIAFPDIGQDNIALQNLLTSVQISAAQKGCCAKGQNPSVLAKEFRHRLIQPEKLIVRSDFEQALHGFQNQRANRLHPGGFQKQICAFAQLSALLFVQGQASERPGIGSFFKRDAVFIFSFGASLVRIQENTEQVMSFPVIPAAVPDLLSGTFPDASLCDNSDGSVTITPGSAALPPGIPLKELFPVPAGIRVITT